MDRRAQLRLARKYRHAAKVLVEKKIAGEDWPEWATAKKRREMAANFLRYADEIASPSGKE